MKYDYAYKRKAVEKYRKGEWMKTPERANETNFRQMIRKWVRLEYACSSEVLKQKNRHKEWSAEERYELVAKVLAGKSIKSVAFSVAIDDSMPVSYTHLSVVTKDIPPNVIALGNPCRVLRAITEADRVQKADEPQVGK